MVYKTTKQIVSIDFMFFLKLFVPLYIFFIGEVAYRLDSLILSAEVTIYLNVFTFDSMLCVYCLMFFLLFFM